MPSDTHRYPSPSESHLLSEGRDTHGCPQVPTARTNGPNLSPAVRASLENVLIALQNGRTYRAVKIIESLLES
jgi:hypothetical protein